MSILQDIYEEGMACLDVPTEQRVLSEELRSQLNVEQRRLLRRVQDIGLAEGDKLTRENYFRGFCAGVHFAECFLRRAGRF